MTAQLRAPGSATRIVCVRAGGRRLRRVLAGCMGVESRGSLHSIGENQSIRCVSVCAVTLSLRLHGIGREGGACVCDCARLKRQVCCCGYRAMQGGQGKESDVLAHANVGAIPARRQTTMPPPRPHWL